MAAKIKQLLGLKSCWENAWVHYLGLLFQAPNSRLLCFLVLTQSLAGLRRGERAVLRPDRRCKSGSIALTCSCSKLWQKSTGLSDAVFISSTIKVMDYDRGLM